MIDSIERSGTDYLEAFCEMSIYIGNELGKYHAHEKLDAFYYSVGRGGIYELCQNMADAFHEKYKDVEWGEEKDFFDTIDEFCEKYLDEL